MSRARRGLATGMVVAAVVGWATPGLAYRTHQDARWTPFRAHVLLSSSLPDAARAAVRRAGEDWSGVAGSGFTFSFDVSTDVDAHDHDDRRNGVAMTSTLPDTLLGVCYYTDASTGERLEADVLFNERQAWSFDASPAPAQQHLASTARHELGHALGLDHSELGCDDAVMGTPCGVPGQVRALRDDDRAGARHLYPASAAPTLDWALGVVTCTPARVAPGGRVSLEALLREAGGAGASALPAWRVLLGARDVPGAADRVLVDRAARAQAVAPGGAFVVREDVTVPADVAPGAWFLLLVVDPADDLREGSEANNLEAASLDVRAPPSAAGVDWQVVRVSVTPDRAKKGEPVTLAWELRNGGAAAAPAAPALALRASTNDVISSADDLLATEPEGAGPWAPGAVLTGQRTVTPTWSGERWVGVVADPDDRVPEGREDDNTGVARVVVTGCTLGGPGPRAGSPAALLALGLLLLLAARQRRLVAAAPSRGLLMRSIIAR